MAKVLNYNTGENPCPEVLFTGSFVECQKYMTENNIPDKIGIEIDCKFTTNDYVYSLLNTKERISKALEIAAKKKGFEEERAYLVSAMVCINNILER